MPYYAWKGVTLTGDIRTGMLCARSSEDLDKQLFARDIALLNSRQKTLRWWHRLSVDNHFKITFFRQLASLLSSGIFLSEALELMSQRLHNKPRMQQLIIDLVDAVHQGTPLSNVLALYPTIFDKLTIQMTQVGSNTGQLAVALNALCDDLTMRQDIRSGMRSAALLPAITFLFFIGIAVSLVTIILPRFTMIFAMYGAELPWATKQLLAMSDALRSWFLVALLSAVIIGTLLMRWCARSIRAKSVRDHIVLRIPFVGSVMRTYNVAGALRSVSMLVSSGMPLVHALHTVADTVDNSVLKKQFFYVEQQVVAGASMHQAMQQIHDSMFDQELIAAVRLGEESAHIAPALMHVANRYYEQVKRDLMAVTTLVNPCLTVILGLMITALIMAVYVPIFSISHLVGQ